MPKAVTPYSSLMQAAIWYHTIWMHKSSALESVYPITAGFSLYYVYHCEWCVMNEGILEMQLTMAVMRGSDTHELAIQLCACLWCWCLNNCDMSCTALCRTMTLAWLNEWITYIDWKRLFWTMNLINFAIRTNLDPHGSVLNNVMYHVHVDTLDIHSLT